MASFSLNLLSMPKGKIGLADTDNCIGRLPDGSGGYTYVEFISDARGKRHVTINTLKGDGEAHGPLTHLFGKNNSDLLQCKYPQPGEKVIHQGLEFLVQEAPRGKNDYPRVLKGNYANDNHNTVCILLEDIDFKALRCAKFAV